MDGLIKLLKNKGRISAEEALVASELAKRTVENSPGSYVLEAEYDAICFAGHITEQELAAFLALETGCELIDLSADGFTVSDDLVNLVPAEVARRHLALAYAREADKLKVVCYDPRNVYAQDDFKFLTGLNVVAAVAPKSQVMALIEKCYPPVEQSPSQSTDDILASIGEEDEKKVEPEPDEFEISIEELERSRGQSDVVRLVNLILVDSIRRGASEIHIEPFEKQFTIRLRLDDRLVDVMYPPLRLKNAIISRIKIMADLDIAERNRIQVGNIQLCLGKGKEVRFNVSIMPVMYGEKVVLKIRDRRVGMLPATFMLSDDEMEEMRRQLVKPGIKVIYGPARSGKSTLRRMLLETLNWKEKNVISVGDNGSDDFSDLRINCVCVGKKGGMTFARVVEEACYGQSADMIMLEQVPEEETAKAVLRAALAGKVVLMEIAAGSATEAREILAKMIGEDKRLDLVLNLFLGTRLVRQLCQSCREIDPDASKVGESNAPTYRAKGCSRCCNGGYRGQIGFCQMTTRAVDGLVGESLHDKFHCALREGAVSADELIRQGIMLIP